MKKAVVLLSGGLDSITVLEIARKQGYELYALSFNYGQRHLFELTCVKKLLERYRVKDHKTITLDLRSFGGSSLLDKSAKMTPNAYVPARNTIFISFALGFAETIGSRDLFLGVNSLDYNNYPDCRPEYIEAFERLANLATLDGVTNNGMKFHTPLIKMSKAEIIKEGLRLGIDYSLTSSCYDPDSHGLACGKCEACHLRLSGFRENGIEDPLCYLK